MFWSVLRTMKEMRLDKVFAVMQKNNIDCVVIKDRDTIRYLTGFTGDAGLFFADKLRGILVTDGRFTEQATAQIKPFQVLEYKGNIWITLADLCKDAQRIGFDGDKFTFDEYNQFQKQVVNKELVSLSFNEIRIIKEKKELEYLSVAAKIADEGFLKLLPIIHQGMTEKDLAAQLEYNMKCLGSEKTSFETIVASGPRSALPHGQPTDRIIQTGDFVTFDFGAVYNGYHSDITRTVVIGKATDWHKEIYETVRQAQQLGVASVQIGMTGCELDAFVRQQIADKGFGENFVHGLGHGVGLKIHELPNINKVGKEPLEKGMVFSIEPGIYLPGSGGVRIEDTVVLTERGAVPLNSVDRQLIEIM